MAKNQKSKKERVVKSFRKTNFRAVRKPVGMSSMTFKAISKELAWVQNTSEEEKEAYYKEKGYCYADTENGQKMLDRIENRAMGRRYDTRFDKKKKRENKVANANAEKKRNKWKTKSKLEGMATEARTEYKQGATKPL